MGVGLSCPGVAVGWAGEAAGGVGGEEVGEGTADDEGKATVGGGGGGFWGEGASGGGGAGGEAKTQLWAAKIFPQRRVIIKIRLKNFLNNFIVEG